MDFKDRPFAVVDLETTGDDELRHEILEIGLLVVRQSDWNVIDSGNWLIKPHHIETALPAALERNGYNERDWRDAKELSEVMPLFSEKTKDAIFTSFNVTFDWPFIKNAFRVTQVPDLMDYHRLDILTLAWAAGGDTLEHFNLKAVSEFFGVPPEPDPHRAIHGAETALAVLKKIKG
jgi:DNA polymerase III epsilon subunit-like protein